MKYNFYYYNPHDNTVVMTDREGKELVIECEKANAQVVFEEPEDIWYLTRLAREEPANYISFALKPDGLQEYLDAMNVFN